MKPFITLCMIVKNEEKVLDRCLNSVKSIVDEIVLVDTGSTDRTVEIASQYTNQIFSFDWTDSFADARNFAHSKANGEWILVLDADEYVDAENLKTSIKQLKNNGSSDAFEVRIYNFTGGYGERIIQHKSIRIYKNLNSIYYSRAIHEQLVNNERELTISSSGLIVYHSGYLSKTVKEKNKSERNSALIDKEIKLSGNSAFDYFNLGNEYAGLGKTEEALNAYVTAYKKKPDFMYSWVSFCVIQIINSLITLERYSDALGVINDAELIYSQSPDFKCLKANIYYLQYRYEDAIEELEFLLNNSDVFQQSITSIDYQEYIPHRLLTALYDKKQDFEKMVFHSIKALNINRYCYNSLYILLNSLTSNCDSKTVELFLNKNELIKGNKDIFNVANILIILGQKNLANKYINMIEDDDGLVKSLMLKFNLSNGEEKALKSVFEQFSLDDILILINKGYLDIYDILVSSFVMKNNQPFAALLKSLVSSNEDKKFLDTIINADATMDFEQNKIISLLRKSLQYKNYEVFEQMLNKINLSNTQLALEIGDLLYEHNFNSLAMDFYKEIDSVNYDTKTFVNVITEFSLQGLTDDALQYCFNAIDNGLIEFIFFQRAIEILIKNGLEEDKNKMIDIALQFFPDSRWLKSKRIDLGSRGNNQLTNTLRNIYSNHNSIPKVSIIVRTYNRENQLINCLNSIESQVYPNIEIVVVNDGGRDVSDLLVSDKFRVIYCNLTQNVGRSAALNRGLEIARGKYINILDDDDQIYPEHIALLVSSLENTDYKVAYTDTVLRVEECINNEWLLREKRLVHSQPFNKQLLLRTNYIPILNVMFERELLNTCGFVNDSYTVLEDWDLWIRLALFTDFYHINMVTGEYTQRINSDNATQLLTSQFEETRLKIYEMYTEFLDAEFTGELYIPTDYYNKNLVSFVYVVKNNIETLEILENFIAKYRDIPWTELVILHTLSETELKALKSQFSTDLDEQNNINFVYYKKEDITNSFFSRFDYIVKNSESEEICEKLNSKRDLVALNEFLPQDQPFFHFLYQQELMRPKVSIVILTLNQLEYTKLCLDSIYKNTKGQFEVIVVDNGSKNETKEYLIDFQRKNSNVKLIFNKVNKGYAGGNNQGIAASVGDYIIFMNNDVIVTPSWSDILIGVAEADSSCGIVGPVTNNIVGIQKIPDANYTLEHLNDYAEEHQKKFNNIIITSKRAIGFCMLVKREVINNIGGFDLRFGIGNFEDDDLCIRAGLLGYKVFIAKEAYVHHFGSITFKNEIDMDYMDLLNKNLLVFFEKWGLEIPKNEIPRGYNVDDIKKIFNREEHFIPVGNDLSMRVEFN